MTKESEELVSTKIIECPGMKNIDKPYKYPPLNERVKVIIKHFRDRARRLCCFYIQGKCCNLINIGYTADPGETTTHWHNVLPKCLQYKDGDETSWREAIDEEKGISDVAPKLIEERLKPYKRHYGRWEDKTVITWEEICERLLANNGHYLRLAERMGKRGVLFNVDVHGNPLIADGERNSTIAYMNYFDAFKAVYFQDEQCQQPTGYEMFPCPSSNHYLESEVYQFEEFTHDHFIVEPGKYRDERAESWVASGKNPRNYAYYVVYLPRYNGTYAHHQNPKEWYCGTRRLLRVRKI